MPTLTEYNPFDHLLTEDELSQYLTDAYEDDAMLNWFALNAKPLEDPLQ